MMGADEPYYVTTPIYYVNSTPHIGHAYTTIAADIFVRHQRQRGRGHVLPHRGRTSMRRRSRASPRSRDSTPQEFVDRIVGAWQELPRAAQRVQRLLHPDDATTGTRRSSRSSSSGSYDARRHLRGRLRRALLRRAARPSRPRPSSSTGSARSTTSSPSGSRRRTSSSGSRPTRSACSRSTTSGPTSCCPASATTRRGASSSGGLQDFSISRAGQPWGVPIPWDPDQVAYVWVDALVNYLSALTYARPGEDLRPRFWPVGAPPAGKDILRFHCVFWPAMLLSAGYDVPQQLFVHGYLLLDDRKISKSLGNVIDPLDLIDVYGVGRRAVLERSRASRSARTAASRSRACTSATSASSANDLGNLALADDGDDRPVPRTASLAAGASDGLRDRRVLDGARRRRRRAARRVRPHRRARARSGRSCAASTATSRRRRPGSSRRTRPCGASSTATLYDLADGLRVVAVALAAVLARDVRADPRGARVSRSTLDVGPTSPTGGHRAADGHRAGVAALPADRRAGARPRDRHARAPRRVRGAGASSSSGRGTRESTRIVTIGTGIDSCRRGARDRRASTTACSPRSGSIRTRPRRRKRDATRRAPRAARRIRRPSPSARPGSTTVRRLRARRASSAGCFDAQLALADELGQPVVDPHPRGRRRDGRARSRLVRRHGRPPLLLVARAARAGARARVLRLVRRQRHVSEGRGAARGGARAFPRDRLLAETDSPYLAPQPVRGRPNEPAYVVHTLAALADGARRDDATSSRRGSTRTPPPPSASP